MHLRLILVTAWLMASAGCSLFPQALRPVNWGKLNAQDPPNEAMYFSVADPESNDPFLSESGQPTGEETFGESRSSN